MKYEVTFSLGNDKKKYRITVTADSIEQAKHKAYSVIKFLEVTPIITKEQSNDVDFMKDFLGI